MQPLTAQDCHKLGMVADLMNEWTRQENLVYQERNEALRNDCRDLELRVYYAEGEMQQMDALVTRLQFENDRLRESNAFLYQRTSHQRNNIALLQTRCDMLETLLQASRAGVNVPAVQRTQRTLNLDDVSDSETESEDLLARDQ